jgi:hypothetical protein
MTASFDIGVGRCSEVAGDIVYVRLDALIAKRLAPQSIWNRSGTSILRCQRSYCSNRRPPKAGEECYLNSAALARVAPAEIDLLGDNRFIKIDLRTILESMTPISPAPAPIVKPTYPRRGK